MTNTWREFRAFLAADHTRLPQLIGAIALLAFGVGAIVVGLR